MSSYFCQLPLGKRHSIDVARLRKAATPAELACKTFLASLGAPYRFQQRFYIRCASISRCAPCSTCSGR